ncbi:MAG: flagellar protein FlaG [Lamprobacter sp.]|uniref:flagellar protein FlaG n=1 Tax=Lamprobacter sp. TaxID=3100796 RepID=UPI002B25E5AB|nr:flagellar protein FlaG [Lamprobacter sp.]MEA3642810.1 flagellar protein FlaG [Lamprobacter sp.]
MSSAITDINQTAPNAAPVNQLNPRQRLEGLLQALPAAGSLLSEVESNQAPGRSDLEEPIRRVNEVMSNYGVQFEMSEPPGERLITRLVDSESGDVIRQIPPEEVMRLVEQIAEMTQAARGGLVNLEA